MRGGHMITARRFLATLFVMITAMFSAVQPAETAWTNDPSTNTVVSTDAVYATGQQIVSDGNGGAIIVWTDYRNGNYDIYAQRLDANGNALWTPGGVPVCTDSGQQQRPQLIADVSGGEYSGGVIIVWEDERNGPAVADVYAQKINASGVVQWTANGKAVTSASAGQQMYPQLVSDGIGGAIITWFDSRSGVHHIYAQRIDPDGDPLWNAAGVVVCNADGVQQLPVIVSDESGGAIIVWSDARDGRHDIYARKIDEDGVLQWNTWPNGAPVSSVAGRYLVVPSVAPDGVGGALVAWQDDRSGMLANYEVYAQKIRGTDGYQMWAANGVPVFSGTNTAQTLPKIAHDGSGNAVIAWTDARTGSNKVYVQKMASSNGAAQWTANGIRLSATDTVQSSPQLVSDGSGNIVVAWQDERSADYDIYAQKLNAAGAAQWTANGAVIATHVGNQTVPQLIEVSGGAIITFLDDRAAGGDNDVYAQKIDANGTLATPRYPITANASGNGAGAIVSTPAGISYSYPSTSTGSTTMDSGASITLTASASAGSTAAWTGDCTSTGGTTTEATCTITGIAAAKTVAVTFTSATVLTVSRIGTGVVTSTPPGISCGDTCSYPFAPGASVVLSAVPSAGFAFAGWGGACTGTAACTVVMNTAKSVSAFFYLPEQASASAELICPASVLKNAALNVGVKAHNQTCGVPFIFTKAKAVLIGNASGTLTGLGIYGPKQTTLTPLPAPAATCNGTVTEGVSTQVNVQVVSAVSVSLAGTTGQVTVDLMTADGRVVASGACMVPVMP